MIVVIVILLLLLLLLFILLFFLLLLSLLLLLFYALYSFILHTKLFRPSPPSPFFSSYGTVTVRIVFGCEEWIPCVWAAGRPWHSEHTCDPQTIMLGCSSGSARAGLAREASSDGTDAGRPTVTLICEHLCVQITPVSWKEDKNSPFCPTKKTFDMQSINIL